MPSFRAMIIGRNGARVAAAWLCALVAAPLPASAAAAGLPDFAPDGSATVREVRDGGALVLEDGRELRLVGIETPVAGLGRPTLAAAAKARLTALVAGRQVAIFDAGNPRDRHGRVLAHVVVDGLWVEGDLLTRGLARVRSFADNRAGVREMLALERRARRARRGIWADPAYALRRADEAGRYAGTFQIVHGRVAAATRFDGQVLLNFGPDWHSAFSLRIGGEALRLFRAEGVDPLALEGKRLRVRGYIEGGGRPLIEVTHPEQIERY